MKDYRFEICANSVASCLEAQKGGADRVELCAGIPEGGTTPSYGDICLAREGLTTTKLHIIIRPRSGDFLYSPLELSIMLKDIELAKQIGVDGVVFGCLSSDGEVDMEQMKILMQASKGLSVTFHRAFDVCREPFKALEDIISLGCDRILTSGQEAKAELGVKLLAKLNKQADNRITLLAGCGVNEENIQTIAEATGIREFHFSARREQASGMLFRKEGVPMGGVVKIDEFANPLTSAERVRSTIAKLR